MVIRLAYTTPIQMFTGFFIMCLLSKGRNYKDRKKYLAEKENLWN